MQFSKMWTTFFFSILVLIIISLAVFSFPYAPLEDLPEWIYQGYIFNKLVAGAPSLDFSLKTFPVPYALFQSIVSFCLIFVSPMITSRIVILLYAALALFAVYRVILRYRLDGLVAWPLLISIVILNSPFWNGYMGYQFGLIVILLYLGLPDDSQTDTRWVCLFPVLAFFAHGWAFVSILVLMGANALYQRRVAAGCVGIVPSMLLLVWYQTYSVNPGALNELYPVGQINIFAYKIYTLLKAAPFHNPIALSFNASEQYGTAYLTTGLLIDAIFMLALLLLVVSAIRKSDLGLILRRPQLLAGGLLVLIAAGLPRTGFGMANPGERVLYPAMVALTIAFFAEIKFPLMPKALLGGALLGGVALFTFGLIGASSHYRAAAAVLDTPAPAGKQTISSEALFGHRLVQFDEKMKLLERAWHDDLMPTEPLAFETALIAPRGGR
ncbi:MAG TPA: hypothetical protein VEK34_15920 [Methylocella sp.]|nr:hypothetical protein [Methylocella sp.]